MLDLSFNYSNEKCEIFSIMCLHKFVMCKLLNSKSLRYCSLQSLQNEAACLVIALFHAVLLLKH